jgi:hypothetical protein
MIRCTIMWWSPWGDDLNQVCVSGYPDTYDWCEPFWLGTPSVGSLGTFIRYDLVAHHTPSLCYVSDDSQSLEQM